MEKRLVISFVHVLTASYFFLQINGVELNGSLALVQILYRHGDRTPVEPFAKDEWKDSWPEGIGQLTNLGKRQQYVLGRYIRQKYDGFLNETYSPDQIYVRSTDRDRTLMSAYCNLAGLYPPKGEEVWDDKLEWQPIPVHTKPTEEDFELSFESVCPKYKKLFDDVMEFPEVRKFNLEYKDFFDELSNYTGWNVTSVFNVSTIFDTLFVEQIHNKTLPDWVNNSTLHKMKDCRLHDWLWTFYTEELRRLRGGPLLGEMIKNMQSKVKGSMESVKAIIYSAHDVTIMSLLNVLGLFNDILPPYTAMVMVELYVDRVGNSSVKMFYRNTTEQDPYELRLPNCSNPCSLSEFHELLMSRIPSDIRRECSVQSIQDSITLISAVAGSILGCVLLMLIVAAYAIHRRNSDQYRYVNIHNDSI